MTGLLVNILILVVIIGVILFVIRELFPEPYKRVAMVVIGAIGLLILVIMLIGLIDGAPRWRPLS